MNKMVLYGVWPNCCNNCDFCVRLNREVYSTQKLLELIKAIRKNLDYVDWKNEFSCGISLLGGELYYINDRTLQLEFLHLIDDIIEKVLFVSDNPLCKFSSVTNGIYDPKFLYEVIDRIVEKTGIKKVDINFSYDLKYRYKNDNDRMLVLKNINDFHNRYNYAVGVLMILTQYVIDAVKNNAFDILTFLKNEIPGNNLCLLYPHPINTGKKLDDFQFKREDFIEFLMMLKNISYLIYLSFISSTKYSSVFKYTGYRDRLTGFKNYKQQPILSDGKEILNPKCGHSILYRCYNGSDKCMLCDLMNIEPDMFK